MSLYKYIAVQMSAFPQFLCMFTLSWCTAMKFGRMTLPLCEVENFPCQTASVAYHSIGASASLHTELKIKNNVAIFPFTMQCRLFFWLWVTRKPSCCYEVPKK